MEDKGKKKLSKFQLKTMRLESMGKIKGGDDTLTYIVTEGTSTNNRYYEYYVLAEDEHDGVIV